MSSLGEGLREKALKQLAREHGVGLLSSLVKSSSFLREKLSVPPLVERDGRLTPEGCGAFKLALAAGVGAWLVGSKLPLLLVFAVPLTLRAVAAATGGLDGGKPAEDVG